MQNDAFRSFFATNMRVRPGERILVFSNMIRPDETPSGQDRDRRERLLTVAQENFFLYRPTLVAERPDGSRVTVLDDGNLLV
jgi:hypothetical protein